MNFLFASDHRLRSGWRFALGVLVFFLAEYLGGAAGSFVPGDHPLIVEAVGRSLNLALLLAGFAVLLISVDGVEHHPLACMGLAVRSAPWKRQAACGIVLGFAMIAVCALAIAIGGHLEFTLQLGARNLLRALVGLFVLAVAAMAEEAAFRGYPFQRLVEGLRPAGATLLAAVFFGALHAGNPNVSRIALVNTALMGAVFAIAYLRTRSLWLPWGIHFGWNSALGMAFGLPLSGLRLFAIVVHGHATGPEWLTGGSYGVEASLVGMLVIVAGGGVVWWMGGRQTLQSPAPESPCHEITADGI